MAIKIASSQRDNSPAVQTSKKQKMTDQAPSPVSIKNVIEWDDDASEASEMVSQIFESTSIERCVRFQPLIRVKDTISRKDYTQEEIEKCWFSDNEYDDIRRRNKMVVQRAELFHSLGQPLSSSRRALHKDLEEDVERTKDGDYLCIRGLECRMQAEAVQRRAAIECAIDWVLTEQDEQFMEYIEDPQQIADVYIEMSNTSKYKAVRMALEDRIAVKEYLREDEDADIKATESPKKKYTESPSRRRGRRKLFSRTKSSRDVAAKKACVL